MVSNLLPIGIDICGDFLPISVTITQRISTGLMTLIPWSIITILLLYTLNIIISTTISDIIIPTTMSSDCPMSELSDPFTASIVPNSFPLSIENEDSQESNPFEHLKLSLNKRYALWKRDMVKYWNPWWRQVLSSSKTNDNFGYFFWTKVKKSTIWEHFEQGADL